MKSGYLGEYYVVVLSNNDFKNPGWKMKGIDVLVMPRSMEKHWKPEKPVYQCLWPCLKHGEAGIVWVN